MSISPYRSFEYREYSSRVCLISVRESILFTRISYRPFATHNYGRDWLFSKINQTFMRLHCNTYGIKLTKRFASSTILETNNAFICEDIEYFFNALLYLWWRWMTIFVETNWFIIFCKFYAAYSVNRWKIIKSFVERSICNSNLIHRCVYCAFSTTVVWINHDTLKWQFSESCTQEVQQLSECWSIKNKKKKKSKI